MSFPAPADPYPTDPHPLDPDPAHLAPSRGGLADGGPPDLPPYGDRWSTWDVATHGPSPRPGWVITELGAVDEDLGVLKTGKEADVHVVRRSVPVTTPDALPGTLPHPGRATLLAAKRYRSADHRMFHRDAGYLEGRRVRRSREMRAMARRTEFGKELLTGQWAAAEFAALCQLWEWGLPVPYPVSFDGNELLLELVVAPDGGRRDGLVPRDGDDVDLPPARRAAPRLAQARPGADLLPALWDQLRHTLITLAGHGWAHGDLSAYNILLSGDRLVVIDWPQVVDIVGNPQGLAFLRRDVENVTAWFTRAGLAIDVEEVYADAVVVAVGHAY